MLFLGGIVKGIFGTIGAAKAAKKLGKLSDQQTAEGKDLQAEAEKNKPVYKTPEELTGRFDKALGEEGAKSDVQAAMEESAEAGTSRGLSQIKKTATSGAQAIGALSGLIGAEGQAKRDAIIAGEKEKQIETQRADKLAEMVAEGKDTEFEFNEVAPYLEKKDKAKELLEAGMANRMQQMEAKSKIWASVGDAVGGAADLLTGPLGLAGKAGGMLSKLLGKGQSSVPEAGPAPIAPTSRIGAPTLPTRLNRV
jgi:hypothetical protein